MIGSQNDIIEIKEDNDEFTEQIINKPKAIIFSEPTTSSETKMVLRQGQMVLAKQSSKHELWLCVKLGNLYGYMQQNTFRMQKLVSPPIKVMQQGSEVSL